MFRTMENNKVVLILVAHVDDLQVSGSETVCEELLGVINGQIFTENIGELEWNLRCAVEFDLAK